MRPAWIFAVWACVGAVFAGGCSFDKSGLSGGDDPPDADPFAPDADPRAPDADLRGPDSGPTCAPACVDADTLRQCTNEGEPLEVACALGCKAEPEPHCGRVVPSSGVDPDWLDGAEHVLTVADGETWVFDTSSGTVRECGAAATHGPTVGLENGINFQTVTPAGGLALGVWALAAIEIDAGGTLRVIGDRGAALFVAGEILVEGLLDASGGLRACNFADACSSTGSNRTCGGPGGGSGGAHDQAGEGDGGGGGGSSGGAGVDETGGGGGGFGGKGGRGGGADGALAGAVYGDAMLTPLLGGSGGGGGGQNTGNAGPGGGGGGALQLTALGRVRVREAGRVRAGGAGGAPGVDASQAGGGGGGSGGGILIESPRVEIAARVTANGGGGGGGGAVLAGPGEDGSDDASPASGGAGGVQGYAGGDGGAGASTAAGKPGKPEVAADGSSGGGGGVGRIVFRAPEGGLDVGAATVSPPAVAAALAVR